MAMTDQHLFDANKNINSAAIGSDAKSLNPDNQDYWNYCSHTYTDDDHIIRDKDDLTTDTKKGTVSKFNKDKMHARKMDALICNSYSMLSEYFDPKLYSNHQTPFDLFQGCKGIIFLRVWKAGIVLGGIGGTGIAMAYNNGRWSCPCAVSVGGIQIGLQLGVERVDDIFVLQDDATLKWFIEKGHFKLGADASIAVGPFGRDTNHGLAISGGQSKPFYSSSFAKGAFVGLSLDGGILSINDSANEEFYNGKVDMKDIFYGDVLMPQNEDFIKLKQLLNGYTQNQKTTCPTISQ